MASTFVGSLDSEIQVMKYKDVRKDYTKHELNLEDCLDDPLEFLHGWLEDALTHSQDANAMCISTVDANGQPSSRIVLIRDIDSEGLSFFTNYHSRKGHQIDQNDKVAINLFWPWSERQVRAEGSIKKLTAAESDAYFASRPRESQIGAWASHQSEELQTREELIKRIEELTKEYEGHDVPRPPHWGGYLIKPTLIEFWQGRASRLHDRIQYTKSAAGADWKKVRLNP